MKRIGLVLLFISFAFFGLSFSLSSYAQTETLEIVTYYPAPYGVYSELRVGPTTDFIRFFDNSSSTIYGTVIYPSNGTLKIQGHLNIFDQSDGNVHTLTMASTQKNILRFNPGGFGLQIGDTDTGAITFEKSFGIKTSYANAAFTIKTDELADASSKTRAIRIEHYLNTEQDIYGIEASVRNDGSGDAYAGWFGGKVNSTVGFYENGTKITQGSYWTLSGINLYNNNSGNVGIGNPDPGTKLSVVGLTQGNFSRRIRQASSGNFYYYTSAFTEYHVYETEDIASLEIGDAVILVNGKVVKSSLPKQTNCIGIVAYKGIGRNNTNSLDNSEETKNTVQVASIGDNREFENDESLKGKPVLKGFKICNEGGQVKAGDLLTTSSKPGFLMKQDDDILHSYTVGKILANVKFDENGEAKDIYGYLLCN